ncbi:MAG: DNA-binding protein [Clostridia bacterium]|nr:DNA-binding protein [Clostridia bacterium]
MKSNAVEMGLLFDFYGDMLTEKQKQIFDLYHNEDLSLAEIAEITGITRQGVRDSVVRSEAALRTMEEKTGLIARFRETEERRAEIHRLVDEFAKSPDFHHITNVSADRIRKIWFLSRSAEETEE